MLCARSPYVGRRNYMTMLTMEYPMRNSAISRAQVLPHLIHKKEKTFIDLFLVGANLAPFLEPRAYESAARARAAARAACEKISAIAETGGDVCEDHSAWHAKDLAQGVPA